MGAFEEHIKKQNPDLDVDRLFTIFNNQLSEIKIMVPNTGDELKLPLGCDLNKALLAKVVYEYLSDIK